MSPWPHLVTVFGDQGNGHARSGSFVVAGLAHFEILLTLDRITELPGAWHQSRDPIHFHHISAKLDNTASDFIDPCPALDAVFRMRMCPRCSTGRETCLPLPVNRPLAGWLISDHRQRSRYRPVLETVSSDREETGPAKQHIIIAHRGEFYRGPTAGPGWVAGPETTLHHSVGH